MNQVYKKNDIELIDPANLSTNFIEQVLEINLTESSADYTNLFADWCSMLTTNNYRLFKIITNDSKTFWGLYKNKIGIFKQYVPCYSEFGLDIYKLLDDSYVFKTLYDCLHFAKNNNYPQIFIKNITKYSTNQINMNYIV